MKKSKIVMIAMFKNEAPVIKRMLDSCLPHVDYYVMQNNGSTDGSDEIAKQFLIDNKLSGEIYDVEEGWIGFGWNRDHLIQYCQKTDHGCDWILKMDCDEVLEVDDTFDWSILDNTDIHSFHVPAVSGESVYFRAWMYNAKMPWRFNHDICHETVYCEMPEIGLNFQRINLPTSFRQVGYNEGQSWGNPKKFITDALNLEEKMIREDAFFTNLYHFWYIGKSYFDARESSAFPLGDSQKKEYARRSIYYFEEYMKHVLNMQSREKYVAKNEDEMIYMTLYFCGQCYEMLEEYKAAILTYKFSEQFATGRNDHLFALALLYEKLGDYNNMLAQTTRMMEPERTNAFPRYENFIDMSLYHDSPSRKVQNLHNKALNYNQKNQNNNQQYPIIISKKFDKNLFVVDNFYNNPEQVREFALSVEYTSDIRWYKGQRSVQIYQPKGIKEAFENIIGEKIDFPSVGSYNGVFQLMRAEDPQVYHYDTQKWAAMIYLSPNAPLESGTRLHRSKITGLRHNSDPDIDFSFSSGFYDSTKFDIVDSAGNVFNRLVIMDAQNIHSAGPYFGQDMQDGRLTHLFFFD